MRCVYETIYGNELIFNHSRDSLRYDQERNGKTLYYSAPAVKCGNYVKSCAYHAVDNGGPIVDCGCHVIIFAVGWKIVMQQELICIMSGKVIS